MSVPHTVRAAPIDIRSQSGYSESSERLTPGSGETGFDPSRDKIFSIRISELAGREHVSEVCEKIILMWAGGHRSGGTDQFGSGIGEGVRDVCMHRMRLLVVGRIGDPFVVARRWALVARTPI